jgi:hypothetical protein
MITNPEGQPKRKGGRPRVDNPKPSTLASRRSHLRKQGDRPTAAEINTETKQMSERLVAHSLTKIKPPDIFTNEMLKLSQQRAVEVMTIIVKAMPAITRAVIKGAEELDPTCLSIAGRWLPNPSLHTRIEIPKGLSVEEASTHLLGAALSGEMSIKESSEALALVSKFTDIQLSAGLTERLSLLRQRLEQHNQRIGQGGSGGLLSLPERQLRVISMDDEGNLLGGDHGADE